jgi:hypothetical protein
MATIKVGFPYDVTLFSLTGSEEEVAATAAVMFPPRPALQPPHNSIPTQ